MIKKVWNQEESPYPPVIKGQHANRPYGKEFLVYRLESVERVGSTNRVRCIMVAWVNSSGVQYTIENNLDAIPVDIVNYFAGFSYFSLHEWYRWLHWFPVYSLEVTCRGQVFRFANPEAAARQLKEIGILEVIDNPIQFGIDLQTEWSSREEGV